MAASSSTFLPAIDKLSGRENFNTWQFAVKTYLQHEGLWECIEPQEGDEEMDGTKDCKARTKIILLIKPENYVHVQTCLTSREVWTKLNETFADSGLMRRVSLLREMCTSKLENFRSVEEYVNSVISTGHKLRAIRVNITDEWIGSFMLAGLPEKYSPMIMAIQSSGMVISCDSIKTQLLNEIKVSSSDESSKAFLSKKFKGQRKQQSSSNSSQSQNHRKPEKSTNSTNKNIKCFNCSLYGHKAVDCPENKKNSQSSKNSSHSDAAKKGFCVGLSSGLVDNDSWIIDSGATFHMSMRDDWLVEQATKPIDKIAVADDREVNVESAGKVYVNIESGSVPINNVLFIPELSTNLLSVSQIVDKGFKVIFDVNGCEIIDADMNIFATGRRQQNLFVLNVNENYCLATKVNSRDLWHRRMGHLNDADLSKLNNGLATGIDFAATKKAEPCVNCLKGKQTRLPFPKQGSRAASVLEIIHSDLCGPMEVLSLGGAKYFLTFIDDLTRKVFVNFLKTKEDVREHLDNFKRMAENQTGYRLKIYRTDGGGEFVNRDLENYLVKSGIHFQSSNSSTPQQNGLAERMNRTLVAKARTMLFDANLPKSFWAEAVGVAVHVANRSPTTGLVNMTPEEAWYGKKPDLKHLRVFGCKALVHVPKPKRKKWDPRARELIFVGYSLHKKGYRFIDPVSKKLVESRDATFLEDQVIGNINLSVTVTDELDTVCLEFEAAANSVEISHVVEPESNSTVEGEMSHQDFEVLESEDPNLVASLPVSNQVELRRSSRVPKPRVFPDFVTYQVTSIILDDPQTVDEALNRHDGELWQQAMFEEYNSLMENRTWDLVDLPLNRKPISCKWVFKSKRNADGIVVRHKARLVIKGFSQSKGIDYDETFSPVVRYSSVRFLMAMAAKYDLDIQQMDAVTAFLQGDVEEEIYMTQPKEFATGDQVCRLRKAIYGLKQASRCWNLKLDHGLKEIGFRQSKMDPCVYIIYRGQYRTYLALYVDDLIIFSNDTKMQSFLKSELHRRFQMKDIGEAKYCLGFRITRDRSNGLIFLDQRRHIQDLLLKFNMADCKPISTPMDPNQHLTKEMSPINFSDKEEMKKIPYQEAVGSLLYISQGTRPDITYAVNTVSKYNSNPGKAHWTAVKRIIRYLKGTSEAKLCYSKDDGPIVHGYSDADWASDVDERRSCSGCVFLSQGGAISWFSKRQPTIALSSAEAEYMALSTSGQEALWLRQFQMDLLCLESMDAITVYCDNKSAIDLSHKNGYNGRTRHIDIRHHFIREYIQDRKVYVEHIGTELMVADVLTKPLAKDKHLFCANGMGMRF